VGNGTHWAKDDGFFGQQSSRRVIFVSPPNSDAEDYLRLGQSYLHGERPDLAAALDAFRRVTELSPDWAEGYHCLGIAQQESGDLKEASVSFEHAVRLSPSDTRPLVSLGVCLARLGNFGSAIQHLREAIRMKPHYGAASAHLFLADALVRNGEVDAACAEWKLILDMPSMFPDFAYPKEEARKLLKQYSSSSAKGGR
jgi:Flp pilus assembly protein TadD